MQPRIKDVAERAGVSVATLSKLEQGHGTAALATVRKLADALGVEPEALMAPPGQSGDAP